MRRFWKPTSRPSPDSVAPDAFACMVCGGSHPFRFTSQCIGHTIINKRLRYPCPEIERIEPVVFASSVVETSTLQLP